MAIKTKNKLTDICEGHEPIVDVHQEIITFPEEPNYEFRVVMATRSPVGTNFILYEIWEIGGGFVAEYSQTSTVYLNPSKARELIKSTYRQKLAQQTSPERQDKPVEPKRIRASWPPGF